MFSRFVTCFLCFLSPAPDSILQKLRSIVAMNENLKKQEQQFRAHCKVNNSMQIYTGYLIKKVGIWSLEIWAYGTHCNDLLG